MMPPEADAVVVKNLLRANDYAGTGISGDFTSVLDAIGDIVIVESIGDVTGTIAGVIWTASAADGTNATSLTFNDGSSLSSRTGSSYLTKKVLDSRKSLGYIGYVGTISTGPIGLGVTAIYRPKISS